MVKLNLILKATSLSLGILNTSSPIPQPKLVALQHLPRSSKNQPNHSGILQIKRQAYLKVAKRTKNVLWRKIEFPMHPYYPSSRLISYDDAISFAEFLCCRRSHPPPRSPALIVRTIKPFLLKLFDPSSQLVAARGAAPLTRCPGVGLRRRRFRRHHLQPPKVKRR